MIIETFDLSSQLPQGLTASDPKLANMMYLPLAEKMIEKMANDKKIEAEAEVTIYLMVLDYLGRHEKAMEVIDGDLGSKNHWFTFMNILC